MQWYHALQLGMLFLISGKMEETATIWQWGNLLVALAFGVIAITLQIKPGSEWLGKRQ